MSDGVNGFLFNPFDESDMASAIKKFLLLSKSKWHEMGCKSRELALERFCEKTFVDKYVQLIES